MWAFVYKKPHRMPVNSYFQHKVRWCSWFDCLSNHTVMVRVYEGLV